MTKINKKRPGLSHFLKETLMSTSGHTGLQGHLAPLPLPPPHPFERVHPIVPHGMPHSQIELASNEEISQNWIKKCLFRILMPTALPDGLIVSSTLANLQQR